MIGYWIGQFAGAILAAGVLSLIVRGVGGGYDIGASGLGQDGWGPGYQGGYNMISAIVFEFVATLIFVIVILGSTQKAAPAGFAGLAIGITLVVIHIFGIHITGVSVNPARSLGPALLVGGKAMPQVWLFLLVPSVAGMVAGFLFRTKALEVDEPVEERRAAAKPSPCSRFSAGLRGESLGGDELSGSPHYERFLRSRAQ